MKLFAYTALAACAFALPAAAQGLLNPQTYLQGGYVELEGGSPFQGATTAFASIQGVGTGKGSAHYQPGYFGGAIFGHRLAPGISAELEGIWLKNHYENATLLGAPIGGNTRTYGGLANLKFSLPYDYHVTPRFAVTPYFAVGAGYGQTDYRVGGGGVTLLDDGQAGLLWQAKTGIEVKTGTPISLDFGYRYMGQPNYHADFLGANGASSYQLKSHMQAATAGIKYTF